MNFFRFRAALFAPLAAGLLFAGCPGNQNVTITEDLDPIDAAAALALVVVNNTGGITVTGEPGRTTVEAQVTFNGGSEADYAGVPVASGLQGDNALISVLVPSNLPNVEVEIEIFAPEGLPFEITGAEGALVLTGFTAGGVASTKGGAIAGELLTGTMVFTTDSGDVDISVDLRAGTDNLSVEADFAGDIRVELPANTTADLSADSGGGPITIDAGLGFVGGNAGGQAVGTLGGGGGSLIDLFTGSGLIDLVAF